MEARVIDKIVEIEGRRFTIRKFDVFTGVKVSKLLAAKILPVFQSFLPVCADIAKSKKQMDAQTIGGLILDGLDEALSLEEIAHTLDLVTGDDLDFLIRSALTHCYAMAPAGLAPVMYPNGTYGVEDVQYDMLLGMRLVYEAVYWSASDFFTGNRLASILGSPAALSQPKP